ncbi:flagellar basal-body rod protein FlgF [Gemmatimonadetes bacterium T265]|nr:flagellar basal-body rod protein FlgF [Gemmatimonadetes bacterium T265]
MPRPTGLTSAAGALRYWERRQELVANNLANVSTDGFKGDRGFARLVGAGTAGESAAVQSAVDLTAGSLRETRNPLDVALQSEGFFVVRPAGAQDATAERWTRAGSFQLDADRRLVAADGSAVLGTSGPITVPPNTTVAVGPDGTVRASGPGGDRVIAQLRVERAPAGTSLAHDGATRFVPPAARQSVAPADRRVRQGFLEESNVTPVGALVDMIAVQRAYASVQKAVTTMDAVRGLAANELGKPV